MQFIDGDYVELPLDGEYEYRGIGAQLLSMKCSHCGPYYSISLAITDNITPVRIAIDNFHTKKDTQFYHIIENGAVIAKGIEYYAVEFENPLENFKKYSANVFSEYLVTPKETAQEAVLEATRVINSILQLVRDFK